MVGKSDGILGTGGKIIPNSDHSISYSVIWLHSIPCAKSGGAKENAHMLSDGCLLSAPNNLWSQMGPGEMERDEAERSNIETCNYWSEPVISKGL